MAPLQQDSFHLTDLLLLSGPALRQAAVPQQDPALVEAVALHQGSSTCMATLLQQDPALRQAAVPRQDPALVEVEVLHQGRFLTKVALFQGDNSLLIMVIPRQGRFPPRAALLQRGTTPHMVILLQSGTSPLKVALTRFHHPDHSTYRIAAHCPIMSKMHLTPVYHVYDVESLIWGGLCEECRGAQSWWAWLL